MIVATSTLELGIDVGDLDRVIQIDCAVDRVVVPAADGAHRAAATAAAANCLFLTTNDDAFLLALGVTQKWSEGWVEAAVPPAQPWPILAQQAWWRCSNAASCRPRAWSGCYEERFRSCRPAEIGKRGRASGVAAIPRSLGRARPGRPARRSALTLAATTGTCSPPSAGPCCSQAGMAATRSRLHRSDRPDRRERRNRLILLAGAAGA